MENAAAQLTVVLATLFAVAACVLLQYETLIHLWRRLAAHGGHRRVKYFSGATFSTVGFGELWPVGPIRFLAAAEALAGLVLITWSASFTYLEMEKAWR